MELIAILCTAVVYMVVLLLWEYKYIQRLWSFFIYRFIYADKQHYDTDTNEAKQEKRDVLMKQNELIRKIKHKVSTFGEYLLACNVSQKRYGKSIIQNVYLGVGKGEALAISGLSAHGRLRLCEILAGYQRPTKGNLWCVSKWRLNRNPHQYSQQVTLDCSYCPLPKWMTVYNGLEMLAVLRGVPRNYAKGEVMNYIEAIGFHNHADTVINDLSLNDRTQLHFVAATVGAPPIMIFDEFTAYQQYSVQRAMYHILYNMRKRGHAVVISSGSVESHLPVTNRLAVLLEGHIYDIDEVDNLVNRYSEEGYTVVLHLRDDGNIEQMFSKHFKSFVINDTTEVLVNVQVFDADLTWGSVFDKMEKLKTENREVYSYVVTAIPIDYVYNSIVGHRSGRSDNTDDRCWCFRLIFPHTPKVMPSDETMDRLRGFEKMFNITKLTELPWSVIFNR